MNPGTTLSLTSSAPPAAVQSVANRVHVVGPASSGPVNTPRVINRTSDLATSGYGPGVSLAAEVFAEAATNQRETGLPVYYTRSLTSTPSVLGSILKQPKSTGTPLPVYGQIKLAGADENGDVFFRALQSGFTLVVQAGGALGNSIAGRVVTLTVPAATAASAVVSYWAGIAALAALATAVANGTGASNAGTTLASTSADLGTLSFTALQAGCTVAIVVSGISTALSHTLLGNALTINSATDADGEPTSTPADVLTDLGTALNGIMTVSSGGAGLISPKTLTALVFGSTAAATGSGTPTDRYNLQVKAERSGALGSCTVRFAVDEPNPEDRSKIGVGNASIYLLARRDGLSVRIDQQTGNSKPLLHTFGGGLLIIQLGTDSSGNPNTTASALRTYLGTYADLVAALRYNFEVGDGSGIMSPADLILLTAPALNWSSELFVPANGVLALRDSRLDTGVTFTFTGVVEAGDLWVADSSLPASNTADMLAALTAITADPVNVGAVVVFASSLDRGGAAQYDTAIQAALQTRQLVGLFTVRGIGEGVANETHDAWQQSVTLAWLGFVSPRGLLSKVAGEYLHVDSYTGRNMRRYWIFGAAGRAASCPYHQDLGRRLEAPGSGSIKRCLGLYHDEDVTPGLFAQGFITATSAIERPGTKAITASPSCADPSDVGYSLLEYPRVMLVGLRIAKLRAYDLQGSMYPTIAEPDSTGAPKGALTAAAASSMEEYIGKGVADEWLRIKSDGQPSVGALAEGVKLCEVLRINEFATDRTIYFRLNAALLTPAQFIFIEGNAVLA